MKFIVSVHRSFVVEAENAAAVRRAIDLEELRDHPWAGIVDKDPAMGRTDFDIYDGLAVDDYGRPPTVEICEDGSFDLIER
jgi:hypothetical protein